MIAQALGKPLSAFKALIFDVDGTLADTEETHRIAFNETFVAAGLPWRWSIEVYRDLLRVAGGKERIRHYVREIGADMAEGELVALHEAKTRNYVRLVSQGTCGLRAGIRDILMAAGFRGQRLAIATTTTRANVVALVESTLGKGAFGLFEVVVAGDEVARKKPAPDVYLEVLELLELPGEDCLAFEDSRNGLLAARAAGLQVVVSPSVYTAQENFAEATLIVPEFAALLGAQGRPA